jgi:peptide/nickel transport system ATP-binding protein
MLEVRELYKYFPVHQPVLDSLLRRPQGQVKAVDDVSFTLARGEVLAVVGESGCGKTTIARTLIGLELQTKGDVLFDGNTAALYRIETIASTRPDDISGPL